LDITQGYHNTTAATWGGRALIEPDGKTWSLFAAQFSHNCPLRLWTHNSQVVRAVSTTGPAGPYKWAEEVYPEFHHNPTALGPTPDGYYLLFMIGKTNASAVLNCTHSVPEVPENWPVYGNVAGRIDMAWSKSIHGPWETRTVLKNFDKPGKDTHDWDFYVTNPSVTLLENGTIALVFSSVPGDRFKENLGVAFAPHWNGTYVQDPTPIYEAPEKQHFGDGIGNIEDPFVWQDARKNFHIIAHSQGSQNVCGGGRLPGSGCSLHLFSNSIQG
jgi:hypothetical protein